MSLAVSCGRSGLLRVIGNGFRPTTTTPSPFITATISTTTSSSGRRTLHAFAPTFPLLKKKLSSGKEQASRFEEDEFEEDVIDDIDDSPTTSSTSSSSNAQHNYTTYHDLLSNSFQLPTLDFKSNLPSSKTLHQLIKSTAKDDRHRTLTLLKTWRKKNLPFPNSDISTSFVRSWIGFNEVEEMVKVLSERDDYGLGGVEAIEYVQAFKKLTTTKSSIEGGVEEEEKIVDVQPWMSKLKAAKTLHDLIRLEDRKNLIAIVSTLSLAYKLRKVKYSKKASPYLHDLINEAKKLSKEQVVKDGKALSGNDREWVLKLVEDLSGRLAKPEDKAVFVNIANQLKA